MFLLWLKLSATHILLPQQPNLNVIERKFKRQILMPDPIILASDTNFMSINLYKDIKKQNQLHDYKMVSGEWFFQYTTLYNSTYNTYNTTYLIMIELRLMS